MRVPVKTSLRVIHEDGNQDVKRNESRSNNPASCSAWMDPKQTQPNTQIPPSALVFNNIRDLSIWRCQQVCGIAPIRIVKLQDSNETTGLFLVDNSFFWSIYSIALGVFVVPSSFVGLINDYFNASEGYRTARMETGTDMIVTFLDIITVILGAGVAIGQNTTKKSTILCLLKEIGEIDALLGWRGPENVNRYHVILTLLVLQLILDVLVWIDLGRGLALALPYFPFYLSYFIMFVEEMAFVYDSTALNARFTKLNSLLKASISNLDIASQTEANTTPRIYVGGEVGSIRRLSVAYARLCDATESACARHGIPILVNVSGLFLHLVITAYFFFTQIMSTKGPPSAPYQVVQGLWLLAHWLRLLQIVVPCSKAAKEAGKTGAIVGNLLSTTSSPATNRQLEFFAIQLFHSNASFSACGFFNLDLPLVVSIMASMTTYLVVLIQFKINPLAYGAEEWNMTKNALKNTFF